MKLVGIVTRVDALDVAAALPGGVSRQTPTPSAVSPGGTPPPVRSRDARRGLRTSPQA